MNKQYLIVKKHNCSQHTCKLYVLNTQYIVRQSDKKNVKTVERNITFKHAQYIIYKCINH